MVLNNIFSYQITSGVDREDKPCSTDVFGGDDICKTAQGVFPS